MDRMMTNSKKYDSANEGGINNFLLLKRSLQRTCYSFSLDHCFHPQKDIEKVEAGEDCTLKKRLLEVGFEKAEEHLETYHKNGQSQLSELTEYYKYYTQTSINYHPAFYKVMHTHREQRKAVQYNRLKVMLDLSNSTYSNSSKTPRLDNSLASSFQLLSMLKAPRSEQSILFEKLKEKLQKDYGPSKFNSLEQVDKQYCFSKMINLKSFEKPTLRKVSKKISTKASVQSPLVKNKIHNYTRNNSCGHLYQPSLRKDESKSKIKRKKHGSMDNLSSLAYKEPRGATKENKETEIKKKIMGMKEQIKKEKELMIMKKADSTRAKKIGVGLTRKLRN